MTVTVEHTHVFAALMTEYFDPTTSDDYDRILSRVSECMSCPEIIGSPSSSPSQGASQ
jgi:hypothetical protein